MSVVVAVAKGASTVIAADSMMTSGDMQDRNAVSPPKIHQLGNAYVGITGWTVFNTLLPYYTAKLPNPPTLDNETHIFEFFLGLWKALRADYHVVNDQPDTEDAPFADLDSCFLIVTAGRIFRVASDLTVKRMERFAAIGCGDQYALGALTVLYEQEISAKELATRAVETAAFWDSNCDLPALVFECAGA